MNNDFLDEAFEEDDFSSGTPPNAFVEEQATLLPANSEVIEIGAGDGRNAVYLAELGHTLTAIDRSAAELGELKSLAAEHAVSIRSIHRDILEWEPDQDWDAAIMTFMHLPAEERPKLYEKIQEILRPGGYLISLFYRPEQAEEDLSAGDLEDPSLGVVPDELEEHFTEGKILRCEETTRTLDDEGTHVGEARVVEFIFQKEI